MACYCANYYGSIHCRNTVLRFGDRCKLCLALKSGASLSEGLLPADDLWMPMPSSSSSSRPRQPESKSSSTRSSSGELFGLSRVEKR